MLSEKNPPRRFGREGLYQALRGLAWLVLLAVTLALVRTEIRRSSLPEGARILSDLEYQKVGNRRERLDVYLPQGDVPPGGRPAILAIHGGSWQGGNKNGYGQMAARLVRHGFVVVSPDYLLSRPGAPSWPENLADVREAVRWIRRHAKDLGVNPSRIAALGASAGGHLAALLGTEEENVPRDVSSRVEAVIDFYGPTDLKALALEKKQTLGPIQLLLGGPPEKYPDRYEAASPLRHVSKDDPPMLIVHGAEDALVPLEQSKALARALDAAGVPNRLIVIEHARHGFEFRIDYDRDLVPEILAFLEQAWSASEQKPGNSVDGVGSAIGNKH